MNTSTHFEKIESILNFLIKNPNSTLEELAQTFSISSTYLQKCFKQLTGVSPKEYVTFFKCNKFKNLLNEYDNSITNAIYSSGYESTSSLYEKSNQLLGMTPTQYQKKNFKDIIMLAIAECSLGSVLVAQTKKGICAISLGDSPEQLIENIQEQFPQALFIGGDTQFEETVAQVIGFIEFPHHQNLNFLSLDIQGTVFQIKVWKALTNIPLGKTVSYSDIAQIIGSPKSTRAVAKACATNKIALAIPCHRVVKKDGNISGYRWGIERKEAILNREKNAN